MGDHDWKNKKRRKVGKEIKDFGKAVKQSFLDRVFGLLEGPIATTLIKLIATGLICATTVALTGILALTSAPISILMSTVGLGLVTTGIIWIFGGWKKPSQAAALENDNEEAIVALENKLADLEERLANVEVIERFEDRLAARVADSAPGQETSGAETTYGSPGIEHER
ncbi:MAG: hypothetical protein ACI9NQ_000526 [Paracoccaceae bacterium]|jgi:hypothetical protein